MERKPRGIRLNDSEWSSFKRLLGALWLRKQIEKAEKKDTKQDRSDDDGIPL